MPDLAIRVNRLAKQYTLIEGRYRPNTLREYITYGLRNVWRRGDTTTGKRTFWALQDVSFEVRQGEVVGLIGRNGAGKSTLLKILSRITEPTAGLAEICGRVGSLLEVGTGFHAELTGYENIYLNGAILGMRKHEIDRKRDDIVSFAEVEKFIHTPVKHYSSGMYMRLAFAVAAHLQPEILLVDEVLAVGDAEFQKKCLGKMGDAAREGRTVIFVSHNMGAITQLCDRAVWIHEGHVKLDGAAASVVSSYLSLSTTGYSEWRNPARDRVDGAEVQFESVRMLSAGGQPIAVMEYQDPFKCEIVYHLKHPQKDLSIICAVKDSMGTQLWASWDSDQTDWGNGDVKAVGRYASVCRIPPNLLRPGLYYVTVQARYAKKNSPPETWRPIAHQENVVVFEVSPVGYNLPGRSGVLTPLLEWDVKRLGEESDNVVPREA